MNSLALSLLLTIAACSLVLLRRPKTTQNLPTISDSRVLATPNVAPAANIREIDFGNFTYDWYPPWAALPTKAVRKIVLVNGEMELRNASEREPSEFFLTDDGITYGDLTGDGVEEAVVIVGIATSGTAREFVVFVYTLSGQRPTIIFVAETGDRWDFGLHAAYIRNQQLLIERYKPFVMEYQGAKHNMSSSRAYIRDYYQWRGKSFQKVKSEEVAADPNDKNPWVHP